VWAIILSLVFHAGLLYMAGDWLRESSLRTHEGPFVVSLMSVVPDPQPVAQEAPRLEEREAPREEPEATTRVEQPPEPTAGAPEAPMLEVPVEEPIESPLTEPVVGESTAAPAEVVQPVRRDVAGEASRRLMEEMEALPQLPEVLSSPAARAASPSQSEARPGAEVGIEGPVGERGLLYFEKPIYPTWAKESGIEARVRFEFWVSSGGNVIRIHTIRKCSYPELESLARQALSRWRFEPLPRGREREERGEVPIIWDLQRGVSSN
jgi:protein TonB